MMEDAKKVIENIENIIVNPYTSKGLYDIFKKGYFAVPSLWECRDEFINAVSWKTKVINGGVAIINDDGSVMNVNKRLQIINDNKL